MNIDKLKQERTALRTALIVLSRAAKAYQSEENERKREGKMWNALWDAIVTADEEVRKSRGEAEVVEYCHEQG
jgi:hypothetical protein